MLTIKKIDYYGQLILAALMFLSVPFLVYYGFLAGLFVMECWQLLSAIFNNATFIHSGHRRQILLYWRICITDILLIVLYWVLVELSETGDWQMIFWVAIAGAAAIAVYYLRIYNNLIRFISLRNELDGLTKSKH